MAYPKKFTEVEKRRFLAALARTGAIGKGCKAAGVSRTCVKNHRDTDESFDLSVTNAILDYTDVLEAEVHRRALTGWNEPVYYQGGRCGWVRKYSDTLLLAMLRRHIPEYRERQQMDVSMRAGGVLVVGRELTVEEWVAKGDSPGELPVQNGG